MRYTTTVTVAVLTVLAILFPAAAAAFVCVHNVQELHDALAVAAFQPDTEIRMTAGQYLIGKTLRHNYALATGEAPEFTLSGGWNPTCGTQVPDASATLLQAVHTGVTQATFKNEAGFLLDNFTISDFGSVVIFASSFDAPHRFRLRNLVVQRSGEFRVEANIGTCQPALPEIWVGGTVVANSRADIAMELSACGGETTLIHNTFVSNRGLGVLVAYHGDVPSFLGVYNSIFWDNDRPLDRLLFGDPLFAYARAEGNVGEDFWTGMANLEQFNQPVDPQLLGFAPGGSSPAIDKGRRPGDLWDAAVFPDFDIGAHNRFLGPRPDAGAVEMVPRRCGFGV